MTTLTLITYKKATLGWVDYRGDFQEGAESSIDFFYETDPVKVGKHWAFKEDSIYQSYGEIPEFTLLFDGIGVDDINDAQLDSVYDLILDVKKDYLITLKEQRFEATQLRIEQQRLKDEAAAAKLKKIEDEAAWAMYKILKNKYEGSSK